MDGKHWVLVALFLGGLGMTIGGLHSWSEAWTPSFVAGVLAQSSAAILALFADKPGTPK